MNISSRTPEGDPNRCPICGHPCRLEPSWPRRDAPCPHCGHLLWFEETTEAHARNEWSPFLKHIVEMRFGQVSSEVASALRELLPRVSVAEFTERALKATSLDELLSAG